MRRRRRPTPITTGASKWTTHDCLLRLLLDHLIRPLVRPPTWWIEKIRPPILEEGHINLE